MISKQELFLSMVMLTSAVAHAAGDSNPVEVEAGLTRDYLNKGYADWSSTYVEADKKLADRQVLYGMLRETERFQRKDEELMAGYYHPLSQQWTGVIEGSVSSTHLILPRSSVLGQMQYTWSEGWGAHAGLRHTEYDAATTNLGIFTVERYWGAYRAAYTLYSGYLAAAGSSTSQRLQFSRYYSERSWLGMAFSGGSELENLGGGSVLKTEVHSLMINGRHWFSSEWAFTYEASLHQQGDYYTRNGARFGLRCQF